MVAANSIAEDKGDALPYSDKEFDRVRIELTNIYVYIMQAR
jgi:hypothetical protein